MIKRGTGAYGELIAVSAVSVVVSVLAIVFDVVDGFVAWASASSYQEHERLELEELLAVIVLFGLAYGVFCWRRWKELRREAEVRRGAEKALREREERFRSLVQNASDMILVLDADGTISYQSPAGERILGFRNDERVGTRNFDNIHPEDVGRARETFDAALSNPGVVQPPVPFRVRHKDGSWRHMEVVRNNLLDDPSAGGIVTNSRDVTEREEEVAEDLRRSEERYRAAVEQSTEGIFVLDGETMCVLETNRAFQDMLGYTADELQGMEVYGLVALRSEEVDSAVRRTLAERSRSVGERKYRRKDGAFVDVEVGVSVICYHGKEVVCALVRDVTERNEVEARLRESEERFRTAFEDAPVGVSLVGLDNRYLKVNRAFCEMLGYREEALLGKTSFDVTHPDDRGKSAERTRRVLEGEVESEMLEKRYVRADGRVLWALSSVSIIKDSRGNPSHFVAQYQDVTERKEMEEWLSFQAFHDPLTGLANRALLVDRLQQALARLGRRSEPIAVLFVDLDGFKTVNDLLGHEAGDLLLMEVAERLKECVRPEDTVARFGGDEFVVLLEGISTVDGAERIAERIIQTLSAPFDLLPGRGEVFVGASIGIAPAVEAPDDPEKLLRDADLALYGAKRKGKGRYELFDASRGAGVLKHLELEGALSRAVERGEFRIYYQPEVSVEEGRIEALEALVRWEHPERGLLEPEEFLAVAEETGLIVRIGEWVLDEACRQGREWEERFIGRRPLRVHVNLSSRQFSQTDLMSRIEVALQQSGLHAQGLSLEVPEGVLMEDAEASVGKLTRLKELGIRTVVDDFGTAYSSLSRLKDLPLNFLKIDRSLTARVDAGPEDQAIVAATINLSHALGWSVIAQGVEKEGQLSVLQELGCDLAQGYFFSKPVTAEAATALLEGNLVSSR